MNSIRLEAKLTVVYTPIILCLMMRTMYSDKLHTQLCNTEKMFSLFASLNLLTCDLAFVPNCQSFHHIGVASYNKLSLKYLCICRYREVCTVYITNLFVMDTKGPFIPNLYGLVQGFSNLIFEGHGTCFFLFVFFKIKTLFKVFWPLIHTQTLF